MVLKRVRFFDGIPHVIHTAYLNPALFPETFFFDNDFSQRSLIKAYNLLDYEIESRDTALTARMATKKERQLLGIGERPVLDVEQEMTATKPDGSVVPLEFLHACYFDWRYSVRGRGPG